MTFTPVNGKESLVSHDLLHEVEQFLFFEAELLDDWRLDDWVALFTEDARYVIPTTDLPNGVPGQDLVFANDDIGRLRARVERLKSRHAHREYPWSRTRRFINNIRIADASGDEVTVNASYLVYRFRDATGRGAHVDTYVGKYTYNLVRSEGQFRIRHKKAVLDNETLYTHGAVSIIL
jgi:p-cumate 2,3-dioxygenase beta subunit